MFENGLPNPRHLSNEEYLALARAAALRGARRNGVAAGRVRVKFPAGGFAPTQVEVTTSGEARLRLGERRVREAIPVKASATAEIAPDLNVAFGQPTHGSGGGYSGPLAYRMGKPMRPDVAAAFDQMAAAARKEAGLYLSVSSGFRSDAEQAVLFAANPNPKWVAPPGHQPAPLRHRARPRPPGRLPVARREPPPLRLHLQIRLGTLAFRVRGQPARPRSSGPVRPRLVGAAGW